MFGNFLLPLRHHDFGGEDFFTPGTWAVLQDHRLVMGVTSQKPVVVTKFLAWVTWGLQTDSVCPSGLHGGKSPGPAATDATHLSGRPFPVASAWLFGNSSHGGHCVCLCREAQGRQSLQRRAAAELGGHWPPRSCLLCTVVL